MLHTYPSEMAQNFWTAISAFVTCLVVTVLVSLVTRPRPEEELRGLVYSLTPRPSDGALPWTQRPGRARRVGILGLILILNIIFY